MDRIVDIATDGLHLSMQRGFLLISKSGEEVGRVPLDDVAAVIIHAHGVTWSTSVAVALAERGALLVLCDSAHRPVAVCLPLDGHHAQNLRIRAQWAAGKPLHKQVWRQVVVSKVRWQAAVLDSYGHPTGAFDRLARAVRSGDPDNIEAQAARRYWPTLMGPEFRRDRTAEGANSLLNYGYTVLRALVARTLVASGLHVSIGVHHANRGNAFALADDMMEPLRPLVDALTVRCLSRGITTLTPEAKRAFANLSTVDLPGEAGITTVLGAATRTAQTLAESFLTGKPEGLSLPSPPTAEVLAGLESLLP